MNTPDPELGAEPLVLGERYRCTACLGQGATATVWRAADELLQREVVVKLLSVVGSPDKKADQVRRFLREARLIAGLRHPNIVAVLDVKAEPNEPAFLVMEYIEQGGALSERLEERRLSFRGILEVMQGLLAGLEAVHEAGIIHRDIKPENLLIEVDAHGVLHPRLIDFGISRPKRAKDSHEGIVRGSPHYMAPEQARGDALDYRADLYAAGIVLYEMLADELPFSGDNLMSVMIAVASGDAMPLAKHRPDLEPELLAVVDRAIALEPGDRYGGAREMLEAIEAALGPLAEEERPRSGVYQKEARVAEDSITLDAPPATPSEAPATRGEAPPSETTTEAPLELPSARRPWGLIFAVLALLAVVGGAAIWATSDASLPATKSLDARSSSKPAAEPVEAVEAPPVGVEAPPIVEEAAAGDDEAPRARTPSATPERTARRGRVRPERPPARRVPAPVYRDPGF